MTYVGRADTIVSFSSRKRHNNITVNNNTQIWSLSLRASLGKSCKHSGGRQRNQSVKWGWRGVPNRVPRPAAIPIYRQQLLHPPTPPQGACVKSW